MVAKKTSTATRNAQRARQAPRTSEGQFAPQPQERKPQREMQRDARFSRKGVTAASLIGGLGIGAAIMYLLDPEAGEKRRRMLAATAGDAIGSAGETLGYAWETASDKARDLGSRAAEHASELADAASEKMRPYQKSGRRWLSDTSSSVSDTASSWLEDARDRARSMMPHQRRHIPAGGIAAAIGSLALGFGAMYLLDPDRGRSRRAVLRDKSTRYMNEVGEFFNRTGRHLSNRARGVYHETRSMMTADQADDFQLSERIRSVLGRVGTGAGSVAIAARNGMITLSGRCSCADEENILKAVRGVRGVDELVNEMEVPDRPIA